MGKTPARRYDVVDAPLLKRSVNEIIGLLDVRSVHGAATLLGVSRMTLDRLKRAGHPTVSRHTFDHFVASVERVLTQSGHGMQAIELHRSLYQSVTNVGSSRVYEHAMGWAYSYQASFFLRDRNRVEVREGRRESLNDPATIDWRRRHDAVHALEAAYQHCPEVLKDLERFFARKEISIGRQIVAYLRLIEPLIHSADSGFVERGWDELSETEWREFLDAGIRREKVLIARSDDVGRANEVATGNHSMRSEHIPSASDRLYWEEVGLEAKFSAMFWSVIQRISKDTFELSGKRKRGSR